MLIRTTGTMENLGMSHRWCTPSDGKFEYDRPVGRVDMNVLISTFKIFVNYVEHYSGNKMELDCFKVQIFFNQRSECSGNEMIFQDYLLPLRSLIYSKKFYYR